MVKINRENLDEGGTWGEVPVVKITEEEKPRPLSEETEAELLDFNNEDQIPEDKKTWTAELANNTCLDKAIEIGNLLAGIKSEHGINQEEIEKELSQVSELSHEQLINKITNYNPGRVVKNPAFYWALTKELNNRIQLLKRGQH